jgi:hypothetical protein
VDELEEAMISVVSTSKAWAARGSEKLRESLKNKGLFRLTDAVRTAMNPLFDKDGEYEENANDVIGKSSSAFPVLNMCVLPNY